MPKIGDPAPQFSATDVINNQTHNLSDYAGKVVLLIFSGPSWCSHCQFEAPVLQDLWEIFDKSVTQPQVQFLMVSVGESAQAFKTAVQTFGLTFPALLDPNETIKSLYGVSGVPIQFVINTEQKICRIEVGAPPPEDALYQKIYSMLIGCGGAEPKTPTSVTVRWADYLLSKMLIGWAVPPDPIPLPVLLSGIPKPIPKDILLQLAIAELAKGVSDLRTSSEIATTALKGAEASMKKLIARNALQPKEADKAFSSLPKRSHRRGGKLRPENKKAR
jgi:peroxiredoxin